MLLQQPEHEQKSIRSQLLADIQDKRLELPTLPESTARIEAITEGAAIDLRELTRVLALDPGVASQLVRLANSPPYCGARPVGSIGTAIKQLGMRYASDLALKLSSRLVFQPTNEMIERRFRAGVADATFVSAAAAVFARNYTEISAERARLAGLVHNVGVFPILAQAEYVNFTDPFALEELVDSVQVTLGSTLLKRWNHPAEIVDIPRRIGTHTRSNVEPGLLDLVVVAVRLNAHLNHDQVIDRSDREVPCVLPPKMSQSLSMMIYEIAGFDPLSNAEQVAMLHLEILDELSGSARAER